MIGESDVRHPAVYPSGSESRRSKSKEFEIWYELEE